MNLPTIIVLAVVIVIVAAIVISTHRAKVNGTGGCSCGGSCSEGCGGCNACHPTQKK